MSNTITVTGIDDHGILISESLTVNGIGIVYSVNKYRSLGYPDFIEEAFRGARVRHAKQINKAKHVLRRTLDKR